MKQLQNALFALLGGLIILGLVGQFLSSILGWLIETLGINGIVALLVAGIGLAIFLYQQRKKRPNLPKETDEQEEDILFEGQLTPPKLRENHPKPSFEAIYRETIANLLLETEGIDNIPLSTIISTIENYSDDPRAQTKAFHKLLKDVEWTWPRFTLYAKKRQQAEFEEKSQEIEKLQTKDLLSRHTVAELKDVYAQVYPGKKAKSTLKKADLIDEIATAINPAQEKELKKQQIQKLPDPLIINKKEQTKMFLRRISHTAYSSLRLQQMLGSFVTKTRPYWRNVTTRDSFTPEECRKRYNEVRLFDDPYWITNYPPHESPYCNCSVASMSKEEFDRDIEKGEPYKFCPPQELAGNDLEQLEVQRALQIFDDSIHIALSSKKRDTAESRMNLAREQYARIKELESLIPPEIMAKVEKAYTESEQNFIPSLHINIASGLMEKAEKLKTDKSKVKYGKQALETLDEGIAAVQGDSAKLVDFRKEVEAYIKEHSN